ncbi:hypothetical protein Tco_0624128 [Tanacetum coccineum]|uniref:Chromo domain-containing protein n=1 Tax=Tanacetum coccineum TaxID=301880 RepID=A0ABQ4WD32_9ASTR
MTRMDERKDSFLLGAGERSVYTKMTFGLKKRRAPYQKAGRLDLPKQIGERNLEAIRGIDMVIKVRKKRLCGEREDEYFRVRWVLREIDDKETWTLLYDGAASSKDQSLVLFLQACYRLMKEGDKWMTPIVKYSGGRHSNHQDSNEALSSACQDRPLYNGVRSPIQKGEFIEEEHRLNHGPTARERREERRRYGEALIQVKDGQVETKESLGTQVEGPVQSDVTVGSERLLTSCSNGGQDGPSKSWNA